MASVLRKLALHGPARHGVGIQKAISILTWGNPGIEEHVHGHGWFGRGTTSTIPSLGRFVCALFTNNAFASHAPVYRVPASLRVSAGVRWWEEGPIAVECQPCSPSPAWISDPGSSSIREPGFKSAVDTAFPSGVRSYQTEGQRSDATNKQQFGRALYLLTEGVAVMK